VYRSSDEFEYENPTPAGDSRKSKLAAAVTVKQANRKQISHIRHQHCRIDFHVQLSSRARTLVPRTGVEVESLAVRPDAERADLLGRAVADRRAPRPAVEPEDEWRDGPGRRHRLHEPVDEPAAGLTVT